VGLASSHVCLLLWLRPCRAGHLDHENLSGRRHKEKLAIIFVGGHSSFLIFNISMLLNSVNWIRRKREVSLPFWRSTAKAALTSMSQVSL
jgi:uncharacterized protein (UPF0303 family)